MSRIKMPDAWVEFEVRDKDGKVISRGKKRSHTWVANALRFIGSILAFWGTLTTAGNIGTTRTEVVDVGGTARPIILGHSRTDVAAGGAAPSGDTTAGILIGTSDASVSPEQYNLGSLIAHGTGAGQMLYGTTTVETVSISGSTAVLRIVRTFSNSSGASITVKEVGLFYRAAMTASPFYYTVMLARDVLPSPVTVPNGSTLTVRYVISTTTS